MTREKFKSILLSKGFKFEKTTLSYPGWRGDEDIYTHKPEFKYTFRVFRMYKDRPDYGLYVGVGAQFRLIDSIVGHDIDLEVSAGKDKIKTIPMWTYDAFVELMNSFDTKKTNGQKWSKDDVDELITVILPTINNGG